ncbi:SRPBCC family protein [Nocardioides cynanchi]|uniref:SRPBCC family protein n=1 Tax=Nocardioides cynanchi TaxID=2558918 RepID=UPI0012450E0E|nr:SRPBCC family protein [Nocardioides cynanchi]
MLSAHRSFVTSSAPDTVHAYLADFTHAEEWDPGTVECTRLDGDGGVGTRYRNVSSFLGRTTEVQYVAEEITAPTFVHFAGHNAQFEGHDRIRLEAVGGGTQVTYDASFSFKGASKVAVPLVALYLPILANKTVAQLKQSLDRLGPAA